MVRSRRVSRSRLLTSLMLLVALNIQAIAETPEYQRGLPLQLEVTISGRTTDRISGFKLLDGGRLAAKRGDLLDLGLPIAAHGEDEVILDLVPQLRYSYDETRQSIDIIVIRDESDPNIHKLKPTQEKLVPNSATGLFVNYSGFASLAGVIDEEASFTGASALLDVHGFSRYGNLAQSQVVGVTPENEDRYMRLDTTYSYSSIDHMAMVNAGDLITGGLAWTQPIRMGGVQVKRDFGVRPDIVTTPMPSIRGTASVPSTLEVFINNVKRYSENVPEGAFELQDIPTYSSNGMARVVLTDPQGRETVIEQPFYASPSLLKAGLVDYSLEAGFPRQNQGSSSFDYASEAAVSASVRYGVSDRLTAEGHAEFMGALINAGAGAVFNAGILGTISTAMAGSLQEGQEVGAQLQAGWEFNCAGFSLSASARRTFGDYSDLSVVSREDDHAGMAVGSFEQVTLGYGFPELRSNIGASLVHSDSEDGSEAAIFSAYFGQQLPYDLSFQASGFIDLSDTDNIGASVSLHMPLGKKYDGSTSLNLGNESPQTTTSISKGTSGNPGSLGWRVDYSEGEQRRASASAQYVSGKNDITGNLHMTGGRASGNATASGSIAIADGDVFLARHIGDAFAIVDAGYPDIEIRSQNRPLGKTGRTGKILVPKLAAYYKNKIEIDTDSLPLAADALQTEAYAVVGRNSADIVRLDVALDAKAALVAFKLADGSFLPVGSTLVLNGGEEFVVGYDGQAYLTGLKPENGVVASYTQGSCEAHIRYSGQAQSQVFLDGVICK
jgi:outer membrane usher protein